MPGTGVHYRSNERVITSARRDFLARSAGVVWRGALAALRTASTHALMARSRELQAIASELNVPSLEYAARQVAYLAQRRKVCAVVCMGTMGSGKSSVARELARSCGGQVVDGDRLHSREAQERLNLHQPLCDTDRLPLLVRGQQVMANAERRDSLICTSISALKYNYRLVLRGAPPALALESRRSDLVPSNLGVVFIHVRKPFEVALDELDTHGSRRDHQGNVNPVRISRDDPQSVQLLLNQYQVLEQPYPWESLILDTQVFRTPSAGEYDTKRMIADLKHALSLG